MSTYLAKAVGGQPRSSGAQPQHPQSGGLQNTGAVKSNPARQTVGFSVDSNADRLGFIGNVLIGYKVEVQVANGMVYEGVFGSLQNDSTGVSFILKYAKIIKDPKAASDRTALAEKPVPILTIPASELVQLFAKDVRLSPEDLSGADRSEIGFETDAAISRGRGGCVRELQPWQPDEGDDTSFLSLESTGGSSNWDQFAVNRDRFGVQTTWSEHFYTTKINPEECRITEAEAQRIANEIENSGVTNTTNIHLLEERGGELAPDADEEALYGAVIRESRPAPYQHPNHHLQQMQPLQQSQQQQQPQRRQQHARTPQPIAPERVAAWGRAGSGVAAVSSGLAAAQQHHQQQQQQQQRGTQSGRFAGRRSLELVDAGGKRGGMQTATAAKFPGGPVSVPSASVSAGGAAPTSDTGGGSTGSSTAGATAPIDIDPRKEVNKVRSSLSTFPKKDRSSPYGTPRPGMSRSPVLASPLVADPVSLVALDLYVPQQVRLDPEAQAEFLRFKEEQNKKRLGQMGAEATLADLKKAVTSSFKDRPSRTAGNGSAATTAGGAEPVAAAASDVPPVAAAATPPAVAAAPASTALDPTASGGVAAPGTTDPAVPAATTSGSAADAADAKAKVPSKLNPNAKPFSLNINAKEFVPSFASKSNSSSLASGTAEYTTLMKAVTAASVAPSTNNGNMGSTGPAAAAAAATAAATLSASNAGASAVAAQSSAAAAAAAAASNAASASPAVAAAAAQAATSAISSGQVSYVPGAGAHALNINYHHSSNSHGHSHSHGGPQQQAQYAHGSQSGMHVGHGHGGMPHERSGYGGGSGSGFINREMREHGGSVYHRHGDIFRSGGPDSAGSWRGGSGGNSSGDLYRTAAASGSGDGYHHHHHHNHHKGAAGGSGASNEHHSVKGSESHGSSSSGMHKMPPPPPQGPMPADGPMGPIISVAPATMAPHHVIGTMAPMSAPGMPPYMVLQTPGGYVTSTMPPGTVAISTTTSGGVPIIGYVARPPAGTPITAVTPSLAMMSATGMASPYGPAVGPFMSAPGTIPPPSPTGRPPSTGYFQPAGAYSMIATAHPGGPHGHPGGPMGGQPGGPMGGHHLMQGPGHGHGPGHMGQHMQESRGSMGIGGAKGGRQGVRPQRMDHDRSTRDID
ncbi:hypothetical protein Vretimale_18512 [Volvox reticuliferus]|uniref:LsmAD domain-containing protein n=1 Tax=Volvox reticuliferus TaxID=1737510 RepID=A0A8J4CZB7_9CHLO|nr:hypothetical protein Vretifemale_19687 [Volvox reticuliferus]GIM15800.1 hypothetical protein Vretimale_18512 [Volvox reticuliferus]